jgi:hypothetical protein
VISGLCRAPAHAAVRAAGSTVSPAAGATAAAAAVVHGLNWNAADSVDTVLVPFSAA